MLPNGNNYAFLVIPRDVDHAEAEDGEDAGTVALIPHAPAVIAIESPGIATQMNSARSAAPTGMLGQFAWNATGA